MIHKRKRKRKQTKHNKEFSTYDSRIHELRGSGYHMRKDAPEEDCSGETIRHILFPKTR